MDLFLRLLDGLTKLITSLAWPLVTLTLVLVFKKDLRRFLDSIGELSFKGGGVDLTAKRREEAQFFIGAAEGTKSSLAGDPAERLRPKPLSAKATPAALHRAAVSSLLWVDDKPANNVNERRAFEALGFNVTVALSTEEAMAKLRDTTYTAIISDLSRPSDMHAGYTLLRELSDASISVPVVIYAGLRTPEAQREARRHGAFGCTNRPDELVDLVLDATGRKGH